MAHPGGRPRNFNPEQMQELVKKFEEYIDNTDVPIIAEFAYKNNILKQELYDWPEFSNLLKKCVAKKESQLEKGALANKLNPTMCIFSLKQLGWKDRQEVNNIVDIKMDESSLEEKITELLKKREMDVKQ